MSECIEDVFGKWLVYKEGGRFGTNPIGVPGFCTGYMFMHTIDSGWFSVQYVNGARHNYSLDDLENGSFEIIDGVRTRSQVREMLSHLRNISISDRGRRACLSKSLRVFDRGSDYSDNRWTVALKEI